MQILNRIYPSFKPITQLKKNNKAKEPLFNSNNFSNLAPLKQDTINFGASYKLNRGLLEVVDIELCNFIYENTDVPAENLRKILRESLSQFVISEKNPDGFIQRISTRIKFPESIREKTAGKLGEAFEKDMSKVFNPKDLNDIKKVCGDIIGARVILRKSELDKTAQIIDALIKKVKTGELKITKIENYVSDDPSSGWKYFREEDLQRLCDAVNETRKTEPPIEIITTKKETGYMALHIDLDLSNPEYKTKNNNYKGEIQILGCDVAKLKDVEDFCYKLKDDKDLHSGNSSYKPFVEYFLKLTGKDHPNAEKNFIEYTKRAYMYQRRKEPVNPSNRKRKDNSLPTISECSMTGKIPEGLDFNVLASLKLYCDKIYEIVSKI